jgi:hypothetical protein
MKPWKLAALGAFLVAVVGTFVATQDAGQEAQAAICFDRPPLGGIEPQRPEWCFTPLQPGTNTHLASENAWVDDFNHGDSHKQLSPAYARGEANGAACDILHFNHNEHWMADIQGDNGQWPTLCAAWMRPNRTFTMPASGPLVIEFEVASPIPGTRDVDGLSDAWPEFTITTDPAPGNLRQNGTYLYETFAGNWTFGCRMQQSKHPICALYQPADGPPAFPYRRWEINQNGGDVASEQNAGPPSPGSPIDVAWRGCATAQDPDTSCRNHHRVEITATTIKFFHRNQSQTTWTPGYSAVFENGEMTNVLNAPGGFFVYFGDFAYRIEQDTVVRFHWDRLAINPDELGEPSTPTPTATTPANTPTPTVTPVPPTATATMTPTPTNTPTPVTYRCQRRNPNGTYTTVWVRPGGGSCP